MADPLFDTSHSARPQEVSQQASMRLFPADKPEAVTNPLFDVPQSPSVANPLFEESLPDHPPQIMGTDTVAAPALPPDDLAKAPGGVQAIGASKPTVNPPLPPDHLTDPPNPTASAAVPAPAFGDDLDPLAGRAWAMLRQRCPQAADSQKLHWKGLLRQIFPLSMDSLQRLGGVGLRHAPHVLQEIGRDTQCFAELSPAQTVQAVAEQAREASGLSRKPGGIGGLLSKVESALNRFDPAAAQGRLIALHSGVRAIAGRMQATRELAQSTLDAIADDLPVMDVLLEIARGSPSETWIVRRQELLLTSAQQMQMALRQIANLEAQCASALQSIDELRTVTLPALGFLQSIR